MLEDPHVDEVKIKDCLRDSYDLDVISIKFLPIGSDVDTVVYRIDIADCPSLFLKLRSGEFHNASVVIPALLHDSNSQHVISPIITNLGQTHTTLDKWTVVLYLFVEGLNGFERPLGNDQWVDLGFTLNKLHQLEVASDIQQLLPVENYATIFIDRARGILPQSQNATFTEPTAIQFAAFIQSQQELIESLIIRTETLGQLLIQRRPELVICHGDIHAGNVLIDGHDHLYVVDWDTLIMAPKERDLMFIGAGIGGTWKTSEEVTMFYQGYGQYEIDPVILSYYRCERILEDVVSFAEQILFTDEGGKDREDGLSKLMSSFQVGSVVDIAIHSDPSKMEPLNPWV